MQYFMVKRLFDIIFSFAAILFLSPFLVLIYIIIYLFDGKKVIFSQKLVKW